MNNYFVKGSMTTPEIEGKIAEGVLAIRGKSLPEDSRTFYAPFLVWLEKFYTSDAPTLAINFEIEYYNTSTSGLFTEMLKRLHLLSKTKKVHVLWCYEKGDLEMMEIGEDYQQLIGDIVVLKEKSANEWDTPSKPIGF